MQCIGLYKHNTLSKIVKRMNEVRMKYFRFFLEKHSLFQKTYELLTSQGQVVS